MHSHSEHLAPINKIITNGGKGRMPISLAAGFILLSTNLLITAPVLAQGKQIAGQTQAAGVSDKAIAKDQKPKLSFPIKFSLPNPAQFRVAKKAKDKDSKSKAPKVSGEWSPYGNIFEINSARKLSFEDKLRHKTIEMRLVYSTAKPNNSIYIS